MNIKGKCIGSQRDPCLGKKDAFSNKIELGVKTIVLTTWFMLMPVEIYQDSWTIKKVEMGLLNRAGRGWVRQRNSPLSFRLSLSYFMIFSFLSCYMTLHAFPPLLKVFISLPLSSASPLFPNCRVLSPLPLLSYSLGVHPPFTSDDLLPLCCKW